ncbi:Nucleic acid-binding, OB-fold [Phaffia rhodozyma]|uniref:Nucleic acid-binding, OB-fold n=1 Tax=Phaffia rhodozyma TaxID=264483 RepID=A0A0F7SMU2_PHARH|nr:Nucleic acid-binding, OB-fold [Phaffia rhodozyma]
MPEKSKSGESELQGSIVIREDNGRDPPTNIKIILAGSWAIEASKIELKLQNTYHIALQGAKFEKVVKNEKSGVRLRFEDGILMRDARTMRIWNGFRAARKYRRQAPANSDSWFARSTPDTTTTTTTGNSSPAIASATAADSNSNSVPKGGNVSTRPLKISRTLSSTPSNSSVVEIESDSVHGSPQVPASSVSRASPTSMAANISMPVLSDRHIRLSSTPRPDSSPAKDAITANKNIVPVHGSQGEGIRPKSAVPGWLINPKTESPSPSKKQKLTRKHRSESILSNDSRSSRSSSIFSTTPSSKSGKIKLNVAKRIFKIYPSLETPESEDLVNEMADVFLQKHDATQRQILYFNPILLKKEIDQIKQMLENAQEENLNKAQEYLHALVLSADPEVGEHMGRKIAGLIVRSFATPADRRVFFLDQQILKVKINEAKELLQELEEEEEEEDEEEEDKMEEDDDMKPVVDVLMQDGDQEDQLKEDQPQEDTKPDVALLEQVRAEDNLPKETPTSTILPIVIPSPVPTPPLALAPSPTPFPISASDPSVVAGPNLVSRLPSPPPNQAPAPSKDTVSVDLALLDARKTKEIPHKSVSFPSPLNKPTSALQKTHSAPDLAKPIASVERLEGGATINTGSRSKHKKRTPEELESYLKEKREKAEREGTAWVDHGRYLEIKRLRSGLTVEMIAEGAYPIGFTDDRFEYSPIANLRDLEVNRRGNLVGVVTSTTTKKMASGDFHTSLNMRDPSGSISIVLFTNREINRPDPIPGSILLLRSVKKSSWPSPQMVGTARDDWTWIYTDQQVSTMKTHSNFHNLTIQALPIITHDYFLKLSIWSKHTLGYGSAAAVKEKNQKRPRSLINVSKIEVNVFFDLVAQNTCLGQKMVWRQPQLSEDMFLKSGALEASMYGRADSGCRIDRIREGDLEAQELVSRRKAFFEILSGQQSQDLKPVIEDVPPVSTTEPLITEHQSSTSDFNTSEPNALERSTAKLAVTPDEVSPVKRLYSDESHPGGVSIEQIISELPCPGKYAIRARVVDYFPKRLEDCIIGICGICQDHVSPCRILTTDKGCRECNETRVRWMYRVVLQLEDGTGSLKAGLLEGDIHEMFPGLPLAETYLNPANEVIDLLRSKLSLLIPSMRSPTPISPTGQQIPGPPLEACVKSYWVNHQKGENAAEDSVKERSYRIFATTLKD